MKRWLILLVAICLVTTACGGGGDEGSDTTAAVIVDGGGNGSSGGDGGDQDSGDGGAQDSDDTSGLADDPDEDGSGGPDDDDAAEIMGNPDLDVEDLPEDVADAVDQLDDIVSIGECEAVGLRATAPEGWKCRVTDQTVPGMDGFTMFTEGNELNITITDPSPLGPACEILMMCDQAEPIALSDNFPDTTLLEMAGTVTISGTHASVDAELLITKLSALTDDEMQLIMDVLDSVEVL